MTKRTLDPKQYADIATTAKLLNVSPLTVRLLLRNGYLEAYMFGKKKYISYSDIDTYNEFGMGGKLRGPKLVRALMTNAALCKRACTMVEELYFTLGLNTSGPGTSENEVTKFYERIKLFVEEGPGLFKDENIKPWCSLLLALDEEYLKLIRMYAGAEAPWEVLLAFCGVLAEASYRNTKTSAAINHTKRHISNIAFLYTYKEQGQVAARNLIRKGKLSDKLVHTLFPTKISKDQ